MLAWLERISFALMGLAFPKWRKLCVIAVPAPDISVRVAGCEQQVAFKLNSFQREYLFFVVRCPPERIDQLAIRIFCIFNQVNLQSIVPFRLRILALPFVIIAVSVPQFIDIVRCVLRIGRR